MRLAATLASAALLAATAGAQEQTVTDGFLTCRRITFAEDVFASGFDPDALQAQFGVTFRVHARGAESLEGQVPAYTPLNGFTDKDGAIFDTSRVTGVVNGGQPADPGLDIDLGSPNIRCQEPCPPQFAGCAICQELEITGIADFETTNGLLPGVGPCYTNNADVANGAAPQYDFAQCPGIGCGGGRFVMEEREGGPREFFTNYPVWAPDYSGSTPANFFSASCDYVLTSGCPTINVGMNCRASARVLVVQENPLAETGPDDASSGGTIEVVFDEPTTMLSIAVLDMDESETNEQGVTMAPGYVYPQPSADLDENVFDDATREELVGFGDNSRDNVNLDENPAFGDIRRIVLWLRGSGSLNDIEFCQGAPPDVNITTSTNCVYDWTVEKRAVPEQSSLFLGETGQTEFITEIVKSDECREEGRNAAGSVTTGAPNPRLHKIVDVIGGFDANAGRDPENAIQQVDFACDPFTPTMMRPFVLNPDEPDAVSVSLGMDTFAPGNRLTCSFNSPVSDLAVDADGRSFLRMEFVAMADGSFPGESIGPSGSVTFGTDIVTRDDSVEYSDPDAGIFQTVSESQNFSSTHDFECLSTSSGVTLEANCTASIVTSDSATESSSSASASATCYDLTSTKSAEGTARRFYTWTLEKNAQPVSSPKQTNLNIDVGDDAQTVMYQFNAMATASEDSFAVGGTVTVTNNNPDRDAVDVSVDDNTFAFAVFTGDCADGLVTVPAGQTVSCDFSVSLNQLPGDSTNVATFTHFGVDYAAQDDFDFTYTSVNDTVTICDQFDDQDVVQLGDAFTATPGQMGTSRFLNPQFDALDGCADTTDVIITDTFPNTATLKEVASGEIIATDNWSVTVSTTCERCPECVDMAMYPGALDAAGSYTSGSAPGAKTASLCWGD